MFVHVWCLCGLETKFLVCRSLLNFRPDFRAKRPINSAYSLSGIYRTTVYTTPLIPLQSLIRFYDFLILNCLATRFYASQHPRDRCLDCSGLGRLCCLSFSSRDLYIFDDLYQFFIYFLYFILFD